MSARAEKRPVAVTPALLPRWPLLQPDKDDDKRDRGVAMVVGGSAEVPGALILAGVAALRAGAGKLQVAAPRSTATAIGVALPEARVFPLPETGDGFLDKKAGSRAVECSKRADVVLIGPGMLDENAIGSFVEAVLPHFADKPFVIDAMALSALRRPHSSFGESSHVVLTPNIGEMAKITGETTQRIEKDPRAIAQDVARELNAIVALKGAETYIATPDAEAFRYSEGDVGLATSGSGDVLAGILVGLLARGATLDQAAVWAVYLHGAAGTRLKRRVGPLGFLARELIDEIAPLMNSYSARH